MSEEEIEELPDEYHEHIGVPWKPKKIKKMESS